jgi:hypothetical protein
MVADVSDMREAGLSSLSYAGARPQSAFAANIGGPIGGSGGMSSGCACAPLGAFGTVVLFALVMVGGCSIGCSGRGASEAGCFFAADFRPFGFPLPLPLAFFWTPFLPPARAADNW